MPKLACFSLVALAVTACSVDNVDGVFGNPQSNGGATGEGGSNGAQNGPSGNGGETNGPTVTNGPGPTTVTNGPTTTTNGPGPTTNNGPSTTTGPDPDGVNLYCANAPCVTGEVCCYYQFSKGQDFCSPAGQCPGQDGWFEIGCNGPADCATGHCCGQWNNQVGWHQVQCQSSCGNEEYEMCFDDPSVCNGGNCEESQSLGTGYSFCE